MFFLPKESLYCVGVSPSNCLNTLIKYFSSEKPQEYAASFAVTP